MEHEMNPSSWCEYGAREETALGKDGRTTNFIYQPFPRPPKKTCLALSLSSLIVDKKLFTMWTNHHNGIIRQETAFGHLPSPSAKLVPRQITFQNRKLHSVLSSTPLHMGCSRRLSCSSLFPIQWSKNQIKVRTASILAIASKADVFPPESLSRRTWTTSNCRVGIQFKHVSTLKNRHIYKMGFISTLPPL